MIPPNPYKISSGVGAVGPGTLAGGVGEQLIRTVMLQAGVEVAVRIPTFQ